MIPRIDLLAILKKSRHRALFFTHFYARASISSGVRASVTFETHSKILQNVAKYRSIRILFGIANRSIPIDSNVTS